MDEYAALVQWQWRGGGPVSVQLCLPQIRHRLAWCRSRSSALTGRRLKAWIMARIPVCSNNHTNGGVLFWAPLLLIFGGADLWSSGPSLRQPARWVPSARHYLHFNIYLILFILRWFGHVQRMEENRIPKRVLYMNLETTRLRGRPRNRWQDKVRDDGRIVGGEGWQKNCVTERNGRSSWERQGNVAFCTCQWNEWVNGWIFLLCHQSKFISPSHCCLIAIFLIFLIFYHI